MAQSQEAAQSSNSGEAVSTEKKRPIRRIFFVSYLENAPASKIDSAKFLFQQMVQLIDGMDKAVWMQSPDEDSLYQYSLLLEFKDENALKTYEEHPNHQAIMKLGDGIISAFLMHTYQEE